MSFKPLRQLGLALLASALLPSLASAEQTLRIGYQKSSTLLTLLKARGSLEQRLQAEGIRVSWHEFPSGLPLLEALNLAMSTCRRMLPTPYRYSPRLPAPGLPTSPGRRLRQRPRPSWCPRTRHSGPWPTSRASAWR